MTTIGKTTVTVTSSDVANLLGSRTGISVVKYVQITDAVDPSHPVILLDANTPAAAVVVKAGGPVTWVYKVTATTQTPVGSVVLVDDSGTAANHADDRTLVLQSGDTNNNGMLDPGETWIYTLAGTAPAGWFENIAKVSGVANGINVYDDDPAWIYGAAPDIKLVKAVNAVDPWHPTPTEDANGTTAPLVAVGSTVVFTYLVSNPGNIGLSICRPELAACNTQQGILRDDNGTPNERGRRLLADICRRRRERQRAPRPGRGVAVRRHRYRGRRRRVPGRALRPPPRRSRRSGPAPSRPAPAPISPGRTTRSARDCRRGTARARATRTASRPPAPSATPTPRTRPGRS